MKIQKFLQDNIYERVKWCVDNNHLELLNNDFTISWRVDVGWFIWTTRIYFYKIENWILYWTTENKYKWLKNHTVFSFLEKNKKDELILNVNWIVWTVGKNNDEWIIEYFFVKKQIELN